MAVATSRAGTIQYEVSTPSPAAPGEQEYTYILSGFTLAQYQGVEIVFPVDSFGSLLDGVAGAGFTVSLLQPNVSPGVAGDYSVIAQIADPSLTGPFSVDFIYIGSGTPGAQQYFVNQYDQSGDFQGVLGSGSTVAYQTPEPGNMVLPGFLLVAGGVWQAVRRHLAGTA
jgi:hypothetical protein